MTKYSDILNRVCVHLGARCNVFNVENGIGVVITKYTHDDENRFTVTQTLFNEQYRGYGYGFEEGCRECLKTITHQYENGEDYIIYHVLPKDIDSHSIGELAIKLDLLNIG